MNKHEGKGWARHLSVVTRVIVFVAAVVISGLGYAQYVEAAQTPAAYCAQYSGDARVACTEGANGDSCDDYNIIFSGQSDLSNIVAACNSGANAKKNGQISGSSSPTPSSSAAAKDQAAYKNAIVLACSRYDDRQQKLACLYGGLGENGDSNTPTSIADCTNAPEIKNSDNASRLRAACNAGSTAGQTYNSLLNTSDSEGTNKNSILDQLDQANSLADYLDVLHQTGPNADTDLSGIADNNQGSYIDGSGEKQSVTVMPCKGGGSGIENVSETTESVVRDNLGRRLGSVTSTTSSSSGGCPAIIWLNGGGWHSDDGTAQYLAEGSSKKNGTGKDLSPPAGGGANERGYTVVQVNYRLGSSGVYYMFEDVMRGIQHVINNAGQYGIDSSKIAVGGDSAGGSLAMRAVASGKSGAKVGIGWSAPTNAYTALFKSFKSFGIGMDHSTCIPTDLAGLTNTTDLLAGGSGQVAEYGQGLSSNDFSFGQGPNAGSDNVGVSNPLDGLGNAAGSVGNDLTDRLNGIGNMGGNSMLNNNLGGLGGSNNLLDSLSGSENLTGPGAVGTFGNAILDGLNGGNVSGLGDSLGGGGDNIDGLLNQAGGLGSLGSGMGGLGGSGGGGGALGVISQVLTAAQYAQTTGQNIETISKNLETAYNDGDPTLESIMDSGLPTGVFNMSARKLIECIDNFNVLSPALFASVETPPSFLAGFDTDEIIDPQQLYDMRDKLQSLGIESEAWVIPGDADAAQGGLTDPGENHLGYDPRFVCKTINFVDRILDPDKAGDEIDCATGKKPSEVAAEQATMGGGGSDSSGGGNEGSGGGSGSGGKKTCTWPEANKTWTEGESGYDGCVKAQDTVNKQAAPCRENQPGYHMNNGTCKRVFCTDRGTACSADDSDINNYKCLGSGDSLKKSSGGGYECTYTSSGYSCGDSRRVSSSYSPFKAECAYGAVDERIYY